MIGAAQNGRRLVSLFRPCTHHEGTAFPMPVCGMSRLDLLSRAAPFDSRSAINRRGGSFSKPELALLRYCAIYMAPLFPLLTIRCLVAISFVCAVRSVPSSGKRGGDEPREAGAHLHVLRAQHRSRTALPRPHRHELHQLLHQGARDVP